MAANTPVFVLCRDRVAALRDLLTWLERAGFDEITLLDNDSEFEGLLEFYETCPHRVVRLGRNIGKNALWLDPRWRVAIGNRPFVYTDPDVVPVPACPLDVVARFGDLLDRHRDVTKVGFGLKIDDLPDSYRFKEQVVAWEGQFWDPSIEVEPGVFRAAIDTTFALYRTWSKGAPPVSALRTGPPYVARHVTWYLDSASPSEEDRFYAARLARGTAESPGTSSWSGDQLPEGLRNSIARLGRRT